MTTYLGKKELFIRFTASAFRKLPSIYVFSYFPFGFEGRMWVLIVSVPDHCLSFYFPRRSVIVYNKDEIWSVDLVDMQAFSSFNKGFKYILIVIDVFSKYAWAVPIKDKSAASVIKAFEKIIGDRIPKQLWADEGKKFIIPHLKNFLINIK